MGTNQPDSGPIPETAVRPATHLEQLFQGVAGRPQMGERRVNGPAPGTTTLEVVSRRRVRRWSAAGESRVASEARNSPLRDNYTDSTGRLRWKTVERGVREARSARAEIIATHFLAERRRVRRLSKDQGSS